MYFGLSEEQKSLEENINRFLEDNASLDVIKAVANGESEKAQQVHQGIIDLGLSGLIVPEEFGGLELICCLQLLLPLLWVLEQRLFLMQDLMLWPQLQLTLEEMSNKKAIGSLR